jgi:single-stranded DNA-binding protein
MGDRDGTDRKVDGMSSWRAGCVETRTSGSEGGLRKRTGRKTGTAPQPDPYVWRDQAENVAESLRKGNRAVVVGRLKTRSWETPEGDKRTVTEIDAAEVAPSLKWAIATPEKAVRNRTAERGAERGQFNDPPPF